VGRARQTGESCEAHSKLLPEGIVSLVRRQQKVETQAHGGGAQRAAAAPLQPKVLRGNCASAKQRHMYLNGLYSELQNEMN
jgi:hypothetical protein